MKILVEDDLKKFITTMVENYIDINTQLQQVGFDITLAKVYEPIGRGIIDFSNKNRELPNLRKIGLTSSFLDNKHKVYYLSGNKSYVLVSNEVFHIPDNIFIKTYPRSTLTRCGVTFSSAVADPGYEGY